MGLAAPNSLLVADTGHSLHLAGLFGLPWMIHYFAETTVREDFGRELRIESVQANPYTLTLRTSGVELNDIDERQLLSWNQLVVDLAWSSITNKA